MIMLRSKLKNLSNEEVNSIPDYEMLSIEELEGEYKRIDGNQFPIQKSILEETLVRKRLDIINQEQNFVKKNYFSLRSFISFYHIILGGWSILLLIQIVIPTPLSVLLTLPLIFYIVASILGGVRLLKNLPGGVNLLIVAQIPTLLILQFNGFLYQFYSGQWIMLNIIIDETVKFAFNIGILNVNYFVSFNSNLPVNGVGINLVSIILISILLKMEDLGSK